jgi:hypothetical protein
VLERVWDVFRGRCPLCGRRGLKLVPNRAIIEGARQNLRVNPAFCPAVCRHCHACCISPIRGRAWRKATLEEWEALAYVEPPTARLH